MSRQGVKWLYPTVCPPQCFAIDNSVRHCYVLLSREIYENKIDKLLYLARCFTRQ